MASTYLTGLSADNSLSFNVSNFVKCGDLVLCTDLCNHYRFLNTNMRQLGEIRCGQKTCLVLLTGLSMVYMLVYVLVYAVHI